jgi:16S rRNA (uracil1498-N3)-methyltransferase
MHRLLVETEVLFSDCPTLSKDAANHLKVLRPKDGEKVELFDGKGKFRVFFYHPPRGLSPYPQGCGEGSPRTPLDEGSVPIPPQGSVPGGVMVAERAAAELTLFACVTKGSRWDWTIEKATELGVTRIVPVISERTIVRLAPSEYEAKRLRWQRVAEDAARQSDAKWLPEIHAPVTFAESLPLVRETTCYVGALTDPPPKTIGEVLAAGDGGKDFRLSTFDNGNRTHLATFIGPEGDFTPDELAALLAVATPVSFGSTILRAETAAIYALSVLKAFLPCL